MGTQNAKLLYTIQNPRAVRSTVCPLLTTSHRLLLFGLGTYWTVSQTAAKQAWSVCVILQGLAMEQLTAHKQQVQDVLQRNIRYNPHCFFANILLAFLCMDAA